MISRQPVINVVQHFELADEDWATIERLCVVESPDLRVRILNFTNSHVYVRLNHLGAIKIAPMGDIGDRCGVYILYYYTDCDNRPVHARSDPLVSGSSVEYTSSNMPYAADAYRRKYRSGTFFHESDIAAGRILHDPATDVYVGLPSCNWKAIDNHRSKRVSGDDLPPPGFQFTVEYVTNDGQPVYYVTMADIVPVRSTPPELTGNQPGVYVTSTDPITGKEHVKFYTSCELCRTETNMPIFEYRHEAAEYLQSLQPSGKKGSGSKLEDEILKRANLIQGETSATAKAKTQQQQKQQQQQSRQQEQPGQQKGLMSVIGQIFEAITKMATAFKGMLAAFT